MKFSWKKVVAFALAFAMVLTGTWYVAPAASAAKKASVKLSKTSATVKKGKKLTLKIKKTNVKKIKSQTWSSSKKSVAAVSKKGVVTAKKAGKATIKVKVKYIAKGAKKATTKTLKCKVTVTDSAATPTPAPTDPYAISMKVPATASNVGAEREVEIVGASKMSPGGKMKVKDNGSMRKEKSAQELLRTEMGLGINLGNTMEQGTTIGEMGKYTEATDFELIAGTTNITQETIDGIHSYGFNTLRVPVSWTSMVALNDDTYTINPKMLGRVEEIVNYALNDGMYVIINDHYDYGWWGGFGSPDQTKRDNAWKRYEAYWTQISERFKDYSDHVIFESANEELGPGVNEGNKGLNTRVGENGMYDENAPLGTLTDSELYETTNKINQLFVDIVRKSGGNNPYRSLLIAGYKTDISLTCSSKYVMPTDTSENGTSKLLASVHFYDPWEFCGDDMFGGSYTEKDKEAAIKGFDKMKSKFVEKGYGVVVGEMGVCVPNGQNGVPGWFKDMIEIMTARGCQPVLWDSSGRYYDREANKMVYKDMAELYNSLTGAKGDTNISENTGIVVSQGGFTDIPAGKEPVWSWTGQWKKNDGGNATLDGSTASKEDITQFVKTESCTDESKIDFNSWGYRTHLKFDWSSFKKPCVYVTFKEVSNAAIGNLQLYTTKKVDGAEKNKEIFEFSEHQGKAAVLSEKIFNALKEGTTPYLAITFGNGPVVTGIYVYDMD